MCVLSAVALELDQNWHLHKPLASKVKPPNLDISFSLTTTMMRSVQRTTSIRNDDDPLSVWNDTPAVETEAEKSRRLKTEAEAKLISDKIDEDLKLERQKLQKAKGDVKVCLSLDRCFPRRSISLWVHDVAASARASRVRKIDSPETIPAHVQPRFNRGASMIAE